MAELALVASIVQIADVGCRLSLRLYAFGETVASADKSVLSISKDISLTCTVLKELGTVFKSDLDHVRSRNATETAESVVQECSKIFKEMDDLLSKKAPYLATGNGDKKARANRILERLRWPTIKDKIELLNCSLDRMKSTLTLMLNVIIYAQQLTDRNTTTSDLREQRELLEVLAQIKEERDKSFQFAQKAISIGREETQGIGETAPARVTYKEPVDEHSMASQSQRTQSNVDQYNQVDATLLASSQEKLSPERLLEQYTRLRKTLVEEVHSTAYQVADDFRTKLENDIARAHDDQITHIRKQTASVDTRSWERSDSSERRKMQIRRLSIPNTRTRHVVTANPLDEPLQLDLDTSLDDMSGFDLDTSLDDMSGIVEQSTSHHNTRSSGSSNTQDTTIRADETWDSPDSWAVKKIANFESTDFESTDVNLHSTKEFHGTTQAPDPPRYNGDFWHAGRDFLTDSAPMVPMKRSNVQVSSQLKSQAPVRQHPAELLNGGIRPQSTTPSPRSFPAQPSEFEWEVAGTKYPYDSESPAPLREEVGRDEGLDIHTGPSIADTVDLDDGLTGKSNSQEADGFGAVDRYLREWTSLADSAGTRSLAHLPDSA